MKYRNYTNSEFQDRVENTYKLMFQNQNLSYVECMKEKYSNTRKKFNLWYMMDKLNSIYDESDPDSDLPQIYHAYQTGESVRKKYIDNDFDENTNISKGIINLETNPEPYEK